MWVSVCVGPSGITRWPHDVHVNSCWYFGSVAVRARQEWRGEAKKPAVCGVPIGVTVCLWWCACGCLQYLRFLFLLPLRVCYWKRNSCVNFARNWSTRWPPHSLPLSLSLGQMWACKWADVPLPHPTIPPTYFPPPVYFSLSYPCFLNANCDAVEFTEGPTEAPPSPTLTSKGNLCALLTFQFNKQPQVESKIRHTSRLPGEFKFTPARLGSLDLHPTA